MPDDNDKPTRLPGLWAESDRRICPILSAGREKLVACRGSLCSQWVWAWWDERMHGPAPTSKPVGRCGMRAELGTVVPMSRTILAPDPDDSPI